jgi:hypothetical protein
MFLPGIDDLFVVGQWDRACKTCERETTSPCEKS